MHRSSSGPVPHRGYPPGYDDPGYGQRDQGYGPPRGADDYSTWWANDDARYGRRPSDETSWGYWPVEELEPAPGRLGGPEGNERLTAITGAVLLVLFAAEGVTILRLGPLLYWHFFLGLLVIGPVCLKVFSVVYRFTRYYTRHPAYVRKGPPQPVLRVIGPFVVLTTLGVVGTGVALGLAHGPDYHGIPLLTLHKASFILWAAVMSVHVLAYLWRLPRLLASDLPGGRRARSAVRSGWLRWTLALACLALGLGIAALGSHLAANWRHGVAGPQRPPAASQPHATSH